MSKSTFEIKLSASSTGQVILDGEDISEKIRGITIQASVGTPTVVTLEYVGEVEGEVEADVAT